MKVRAFLFFFILVLPLLGHAETLEQLFSSTYPICARAGRLEYAREVTASETEAQEAEQAVSEALSGSWSSEVVAVAEGNSGCGGIPDLGAAENLMGFVENDGPIIVAQALDQAPPPPSREDRVRRVVSQCAGEQEEDFTQALRLARWVYHPENRPADLPDPPYHVVENINDRRSGLKAMVVAGPGDERTIAFAGSQGLMDWVNNLQSGRPQYQAMQRHLESQVQYVLGGGKLRCTGHSLGGALAQAFCARVMEEVFRRNPGYARFPQENPIQTVTFNTMGADRMLRSDGHGPVSGIANSWFNDNSIHFVCSNDVVHRILPLAYGQVRRLSSGCQEGVLRSHDLNVMANQVENDLAALANREGFSPWRSVRDATVRTWRAVARRPDGPTAQ